MLLLVHCSTTFILKSLVTLQITIITLNYLYIYYDSSGPGLVSQRNFFSRNGKSAQITVVCKGKCFRIQSSPALFCQSPSSLETYIRLVDSLCDNEDDDLVDSAKEDLQHWVLGPLLPIFDQIEPTLLNQYPLTFQDYLFPETYR